MVTVTHRGAYWLNGQPVWAEDAKNVPAPAEARQRTIAYQMFQKHNQSDDPNSNKV